MSVGYAWLSVGGWNAKISVRSDKSAGVATMFHTWTYALALRIAYQKVREGKNVHNFELLRQQLIASQNPWVPLERGWCCTRPDHRRTGTRFTRARSNGSCLDVCVSAWPFVNSGEKGQMRCRRVIFFCTAWSKIMFAVLATHCILSTWVAPAKEQENSWQDCKKLAGNGIWKTSPYHCLLLFACDVLLVLWHAARKEMNSTVRYSGSSSDAQNIRYTASTYKFQEISYTLMPRHRRSWDLHGTSHQRPGVAATIGVRLLQYCQYI